MQQIISNTRRMIKGEKERWMKKYFEGKWFLERTIFHSNEDRPYGIANGVAYFTSADKKSLIYKEEGKLSLISTGQEYPFYRSFIYVFEGDQVEIFFNDGFNSGQLYQSYNLDFDNRVLTPSIQHICKDDCYNGIYSIVSPSAYKLQTAIKGPKKNFKIETYAKKA